MDEFYLMSKDKTPSDEDLDEIDLSYIPPSTIEEQEHEYMFRRSLAEVLQSLSYRNEDVAIGALLEVYQDLLAGLFSRAKVGINKAIVLPDMNKLGTAGKKLFTPKAVAQAMVKLLRAEKFYAHVSGDKVFIMWPMNKPEHWEKDN